MSQSSHDEKASETSRNRKQKIPRGIFCSKYGSIISITPNVFLTMKKFVAILLVAIVIVTAHSASAMSLRIGLRGNADVMTIQQQLKSQGFYSGSIDGNFGPMTRSAVIQFQSNHSLVADGIVGTKTQALLLGNSSASISAIASILPATASTTSIIPAPNAPATSGIPSCNAGSGPTVAVASVAGNFPAAIGTPSSAYLVWSSCNLPAGSTVKLVASSGTWTVPQGNDYFQFSPMVEDGSMANLNAYDSSGNIIAHESLVMEVSNRLGFTTATSCGTAITNGYIIPSTGAPNMPIAVTIGTPFTLNWNSCAGLPVTFTFSGTLTNELTQWKSSSSVSVVNDGSQAFVINDNVPNGYYKFALKGQLSGNTVGGEFSLKVSH